MPHVIANVIIEDGQLKYVDRKLPAGKIRAHIVYDSVDKGPVSKSNTAKLLRETAGLYKDIKATHESRLLRDEWERDAKN